MKEECKYCSQDFMKTNEPIYKNRYSMVRINSIKELEIEYDEEFETQVAGRWSMEIEIEYCPKCGRKL